MKEKGLYVMSTERGEFLRKAEFDEQLGFNANFIDSLMCSTPVDVYDNDGNINKDNLVFTEKLAEFLSQGGDEIVPVFVEIEIKVKGFDGTEYNVQEIQSKFVEERKKEAEEFYKNLFERNN